MKLLKTMTSWLLLAIPALALGKLPPPTPAQAQAAAEKKALAQATADKEKQALLTAMDAIAARWRGRAGSEGWTVNPPVAVAAPMPALAQPNTQTSASGQPGGVMGSAAKTAPMTSEKSGTAAPSADVKKAAMPSAQPKR
jgi:Tfp pilus assembly protein PilV